MTSWLQRQGVAAAAVAAVGGGGQQLERSTSPSDASSCLDGMDDGSTPTPSQG